jgi:4-alpha-glucanotransferase
MISTTKRIGTLLPISALISNSATRGSFQAGLKFVDWLARSKQSVWQLLPLSETQLQNGSATIHVPSPYKGYCIGLDPKYLSPSDITPTKRQLASFIKNNDYWLGNYALFCALRDYFKTDKWSKWPNDIRHHNEKVMIEWKAKLATEISNNISMQAKLYYSYKKIINSAKKHKILLIGDMPFYIGLNSPLVWQNQQLFDLDNMSIPRYVSGVLDSTKAHFGRQVWGHPLYQWQDKRLIPELKILFEIRLKYLASLFNYIRLDHAKGFYTYAAIDISNTKGDCNLNGPGDIFLTNLIHYSQHIRLKMYAEDSGANLAELRKCLHSHHLPGIKIFRFAYNEKRHIFSEQYIHIDSYPTNSVAYTTTHDTETLIGYLQNLSISERSNLCAKLKINPSKNIYDLAKEIRNQIINSPAKIVILPLQDWLLTTDRINIPGTEKEIGDTNWQYQMDIPIEDLPIKFQN